MAKSELRGEIAYKTQTDASHELRLRLLLLISNIKNGLGVTNSKQEV